MAKIQGITIKLDADSSGVEKALKDVDKASSSTTKELGQINRALKFDEFNPNLLQQKFDVLQDAINNTSTRLDALKQAQAEVDRQFAAGEIDAAAYRAFQRELEITEGKLDNFRKQASDVKVKIDSQTDVSGIDKMKAALNELGDKAKETGEKMKEVGSNLTTSVTAPIAALGVAAGLSATQFDQANAKIQASLGLTKEEAEKLEDSATSLWKAGFGESLEEVTDALVKVKQNMKDVADGTELETVTKNAILLAQTFEADVNEVTRAGNNLMVNFGITSEKAFDLMAKGAQNGLNFSQEMFDNLAEYAPLFADMGYSAEEYFGILQRGSEAGIYNLDYANDLMKEFQIRVKDGSDATTEAFDEMSLKTQQVWNEFLSGNATVKDVAAQVVGELQTMDDQVYANQLGVALFGTKFEDLEADAVYAMLSSTKAMEGFEGSMQGISDTQEQTFGQRWQSMIRNASASLEPLGNILLDLAEQWLPKIIAVVETLAQWFSNLSPVMQIVTVAIGGILAAIGPLLVAIGSVISALGTLIPLFSAGGAGAAAFGAIMAALSGPVGIVIGIITALIAIGIALWKNWDEVSVFLSTVWEGIKSVASNVFSAIGDVLTSVWESIKSTTESVWNGIKDFFSTIWEGIKTVFDMVIGAIKSLLDSYWDSMGDGIKTVWEGIKQYFSAVWDLIKNVFVGALLVVLQLLTGQWDEAKKSTEKIWKNIQDALKNVWDAVKKIFSGALDAVKGYVTTSWENIKNTTSTVFNNIKSTISTIWDNIKSVIANAVASILTTITSKFIEIVNSVRNKMNDVLSTIKDIWGNVTSFFGGINLYSIGADMIQGLINGIKSMASGVVRAISNTVNNAIKAAKDLLDINSPSRVFMEFGEFTNEGFIKGIENTNRRLQNAVGNTYGSLASSAQKSMEYGSSSLTSSTSTIDNSKYMQPNITIINQVPNASPAEIARKALQTQRQLAMEWGV